MMKSTSTHRLFQMSIDIEATPEEVWKALTDAGELTRWFPLQARVTPGPGGRVFWGWDDHWAWESHIDTWEPNKRLTLVENRPAFDVKGNPLPGPARRLAMEFSIERDGARTTVRLVHSGFGDDASWDDELDSVGAGWRFELRGLRHYLEHHRGRNRCYAAAHAVTPLPQEAAWGRLLSPAAFSIAEGALEQDSHLVIRSATGEHFSGTVAWHNPGHDLFVRVKELDDGGFRLSTWRAGGQTGVQVWLTSYDEAHSAQIKQFGENVQQLVNRLF